MTDFELFMTVWFGSLGVMVAFLALHYLAHIVAALLSEGWRRWKWRRSANARLASLRPLANGRRGGRR